ncbi:MAG: hypothetical protein IJH20_02960 [Bacilli bacterium]|nr:hypothetical protein [Bacilli bacterium]
MNRHKVLLFLLTVVILLGSTACSIVNISSNNYIKNIEAILSRNSKYVNKGAIGFQYFLPNGVSVFEVNDFNQKLLSNGDIYYLYADVVSYYHGVNNSYEENENAYLSKKFEYNNKQGYVEVNEAKNSYFVEMMFNYAKIESVVKKSNLKDSLNNMAYILSSIKYNDDVVENLLGDEKYKVSEAEKYNIFETKKVTNDNFLKYDEEYGHYDGEDAVDLIEKKEINQNEDN